MAVVETGSAHFKPPLGVLCLELLEPVCVALLELLAVALLELLAVALLELLAVALLELLRVAAAELLGVATSELLGISASELLGISASELLGIALLELTGGGVVRLLELLITADKAEDEESPCSFGLFGSFSFWFEQETTRNNKNVRKKKTFFILPHCDFLNRRPLFNYINSCFLRFYIAKRLAF